MTNGPLGFCVRDWIPPATFQKCEKFTSSPTADFWESWLVVKSDRLRHQIDQVRFNRSKLKCFQGFFAKCFQCDWITEFGTSVSQDIFKCRSEFISSHTFFQIVKNKAYSTFCTADLILLTQLLSGYVDPWSGVMKFLAILPVWEPCIIVVLVGDDTVIDFLRAAITDIRRFIKSITVFFLKVLASLIAGRTGSAFDTTQDEQKILHYMQKNNLWSMIMKYI